MTAIETTEFIVRFEMEDILRGGADDTARGLLETWLRNSGRICDEIANYMSDVALMDGRPDAADSPDILFCGQKSLLARRLGADWADHPRIAKNTFQDEYRTLCAKAYFDAATSGQPVFDMIHAKHALRKSYNKPVTYHRLLLPVHSANGVKFTLCYSLDLTARRLSQEDDEQSSRSLVAGIRQNINLNRPHFPADCPI